MNILFFKKKIKEKISVLGSKSISNRVLMISSLCNKQITKIENLSNSEDTKIMINFLLKTKVKIYKKENFFYVLGKITKIKNKNIFLKNAGTVIRPIFFLSNFFTVKNINILGNLSMQKRTIKELNNVSNSLGGKTFFFKKKGYIPSKNYRSKIKHKKIKVNCFKSSQYASSLLIVLPIFKNKNFFFLTNISSYFYILLTLKIIKLFNIKIKKKLVNKNIFIFTKGKYKSCKNITIENDFSSLSYFFFKLFFLKKRVFKFISITKQIHQGDVKILNCLKKIGIFIFKENRNFYLFFKKKKIKNLKVNCKDIPDSSMSIPLLIFKKIKRIKIFNIRSWNFKESNRIFSISNELKKMGCKIKRGKNWLIIKKFFINNNKKFFLKTYNDHRILMCFFLVKKYFKKFFVCNSTCVKKTFENFIFEILKF
ncbi:3-phosphoshikimate 1-carboxyvinyltransferase [Candidatus Vidania fulgoroideae]|uniref:3-phosphoshikimate 1-carboxyvinyltransferase n=1 Tax=Candidatus Vidania fulgoroideorum TaxID=881286 RepID=A0A346E0L0_9PROT|nr:3-phosphoshikimate 1-carboxyvinyltransferase [Candidatus Vidania fulgoroideae]